MVSKKPRQPLSAAVLCAGTLCACQEGSAKVLSLRDPLAGQWRATSSAVTSTCEPDFPAYPSLSYGIVRFDRQGSAFTLTREGCCEDIPLGTGALDGDTIRIQIGHLPIDRGPGCALLRDESVVGSVSDGRILGEDTFKVLPSGDCGSGFPCEVRANFILERCQRPCGIFCAQLICEP
jgi:hypothetical protein